MKYRVEIKKSKDGYSVSCPGLPGCWSQGKTREEALKNIREAIDLYLEPSPEDLAKSDNREIVELTL